MLLRVCSAFPTRFSQQSHREKHWLNPPVPPGTALHCLTYFPGLPRIFPWASACLGTCAVRLRHLSISHVKRLERREEIPACGCLSAYRLARGSASPRAVIRYEMVNYSSTKGSLSKNNNKLQRKNSEELCCTHMVHRFWVTAAAVAGVSVLASTISGTRMATVSRPTSCS